MNLFWPESWDSRVEKRKQENLEDEIQVMERYIKRLEEENKRLKEQINAINMT